MISRRYVDAYYYYFSMIRWANLHLNLLHLPTEEKFHCAEALFEYLLFYQLEGWISWELKATANEFP